MVDDPNTPAHFERTLDVVVGQTSEAADPDVKERLTRTGLVGVAVLGLALASHWLVHLSPLTYALAIGGFVTLRVGLTSQPRRARAIVRGEHVSVSSTGIELGGRRI